MRRSSLIPPHAFTVYCQWPGCGTYSYGATQERLDAHTAITGSSLVKRTRHAGLWACRGHAYAVGGGWAE